MAFSKGRIPLVSAEGSFPSSSWDVGSSNQEWKARLFTLDGSASTIAFSPTTTPEEICDRLSLSRSVAVFALPIASSSFELLYPHDKLRDCFKRWGAEQTAQMRLVIPVWSLKAGGEGAPVFLGDKSVEGASAHAQASEVAQLRAQVETLRHANRSLVGGALEKAANAAHTAAGVVIQLPSPVSSKPMPVSSAHQKSNGDATPPQQRRPSHPPDEPPSFSAPPPRASTENLQSAATCKKGWLMKQGGRRALSAAWQPRWCVLHVMGGSANNKRGHHHRFSSCIEYFKHPTDPPSQAKGRVPLSIVNDILFFPQPPAPRAGVSGHPRSKSVSQALAGPPQWSFALVTADKSYTFECGDEADFKSWEDILKRAWSGDGDGSLGGRAGVDVAMLAGDGPKVGDWDDDDDDEDDDDEDDDEEEEGEAEGKAQGAGEVLAKNQNPLVVHLTGDTLSLVAHVVQGTATADFRRDLKAGLPQDLSEGALGRLAQVRALACVCEESSRGWGEELKQEILASLFPLLRDVLDRDDFSSSSSSLSSSSLVMLAAVLTCAEREGLCDGPRAAVSVELDECLAAMVADQLSDVVATPPPPPLPPPSTNLLSSPSPEDGRSDGGGSHHAEKELAASSSALQGSGSWSTSDEAAAAASSSSSLGSALHACGQVLACLSFAAAHVQPLLPPSLIFMQRYASATHRAVTEVVLQQVVGVGERNVNTEDALKLLAWVHSLRKTLKKYHPGLELGSRFEHLREVFLRRYHSLLAQEVGRWVGNILSTDLEAPLAVIVLHDLLLAASSSSSPNPSPPPPPPKAPPNHSSPSATTSSLSSPFTRNRSSSSSSLFSRATTRRRRSSSSSAAGDNTNQQQNGGSKYMFSTGRRQEEQAPVIGSELVVTSAPEDLFACVGGQLRLCCSRLSSPHDRGLTVKVLVAHGLRRFTKAKLAWLKAGEEDAKNKAQVVFAAHGLGTRSEPSSSSSSSSSLAGGHTQAMPISSSSFASPTPTSPAPAPLSASSSSSSSSGLDLRRVCALANNSSRCLALLDKLASDLKEIDTMKQAARGEEDDEEDQEEEGGRGGGGKGLGEEGTAALQGCLDEFAVVSERCCRVLSLTIVSDLGATLGSRRLLFTPQWISSALEAAAQRRRQRRQRGGGSSSHAAVGQCGEDDDDEDEDDEEEEEASEALETVRATVDDYFADLSVALVSEHFSKAAALTLAHVCQTVLETFLLLVLHQPPSTTPTKPLLHTLKHTAPAPSLDDALSSSGSGGGGGGGGPFERSKDRKGSKTPFVSSFLLLQQVEATGDVSPPPLHSLRSSLAHSLPDDSSFCEQHASNPSSSSSISSNGGEHSNPPSLTSEKEQEGFGSCSPVLAGVVGRQLRADARALLKVASKYSEQDSDDEDDDDDEDDITAAASSGEGEEEIKEGSLRKHRRKERKRGGVLARHVIAVESVGAALVSLERLALARRDTHNRLDQEQSPPQGEEQGGGGGGGGGGAWAKAAASEVCRHLSEPFGGQAFAVASAVVTLALATPPPIPAAGLPLPSIPRRRPSATTSGGQQHTPPLAVVEGAGGAGGGGAAAALAAAEAVMAEAALAAEALLEEAARAEQEQERKRREAEVADVLNECRLLLPPSSAPSPFPALLKGNNPENGPEGEGDGSGSSVGGASRGIMSSVRGLLFGRSSNGTGSGGSLGSSSTATHQGASSEGGGGGRGGKLSLKTLSHAAMFSSSRRRASFSIPSSSSATAAKSAAAAAAAATAAAAHNEGEDTRFDARFDARVDTRFDVEFSGATLGLGLQPPAPHLAHLGFLPVVTFVPEPGSAPASAMAILRVVCAPDPGAASNVRAVAVGDVVECVAGVALLEALANTDDPYSHAIQLIKASAKPLVMQFRRRVLPR